MASGSFVSVNCLHTAPLSHEHIVIEGHDEYVEVVSQSWQWQEVAATPDS